MNTEAFGERSFRGPPSRTLVCCTSKSLPIIAWVVDGQTDSYHWQFRNMKCVLLSCDGLRLNKGTAVA